MIEKGDERVWELLQGERVVTWLPTDSNALARIRAQLLRKAGGIKLHA